MNTDNKVTANIHETAVVAPGAKIAENVEIGPYSVIGENVEIGEGTKIGPHVVTLAQAEDLPAHGEAVTARTGEGAS